MKAPAPNSAPGAVTAQHDFYNATSNGGKLFSVRGGIPLPDAFDALTLLLSKGMSVVGDVSVSVSAGEVPQGQHAAIQLLELTHALVQSMHKGLIEHARAPAQPPVLTPLHVVP